MRLGKLINFVCIKPFILLQAEEVILKGFPEKIIELNQLLEKPQFNQKDPSKLHEDLNIPVPSPISFKNRWDTKYVFLIKHTNLHTLCKMRQLYKFEYKPLFLLKITICVLLEISVCPKSLIGSVGLWKLDTRYVTKFLHIWT